MTLIAELRLLLAAQLLTWAFNAVPKRGCNDTAPVWLGIQKAAEGLARVRVARGAKKQDKHPEGSTP